jgi:molybdopterin converting factor subunit 1
MKSVRVLYFAAIRELVGKSEEDVELPDDIQQLAELVAWLERERRLAGKLGSVRFAINETFVGPNAPIGSGDVIAVIPPVAGG